MLHDGGDEALAIASELGIADAGKIGKLLQIAGTALGHFAQRGVVKHDVGRQPMLIRQTLAQGAQAFEQGAVFG